MFIEWGAKRVVFVYQQKTLSVNNYSFITSGYQIIDNYQGV